ncbi:2Fe-2S iron-sulfur cluster binding domain-containing protein [Candidatus Pacearchaeota archaeon]|nr:2Fe-2S iron-sulfur cluster binding domain-containing protein [Candidatus Pacearchaeota archaeon]
MAKIITKDKEIEVPDGSTIADALKELGVPFSCEDGDCGTCMIEIEEGMGNLSERTEPEKLMTFDNLRLGCQCKIMKGDVRIRI